MVQQMPFGKAWLFFRRLEHSCGNPRDEAARSKPGVVVKQNARTGEQTISFTIVGDRPECRRHRQLRALSGRGRRRLRFLYQTCLRAPEGTADSGSHADVSSNPNRAAGDPLGHDLTRISPYSGRFRVAITSATSCCALRPPPPVSCSSHVGAVQLPLKEIHQAPRGTGCSNRDAQLLQQIGEARIARHPVEAG